MKKIVLAACAFAAISLNACTETHDSVKPITASDTTYMATPETAMPRNVLIEEATGVKCINCPNGAAILKIADEDNNDRLVIVGIHAGSLTEPIPGVSQYNFISKAAKDLLEIFFGDDPAKPQACIDRVKQSNGKFFAIPGTWLTQINGRLQQPSKQNITITSDYDDATRRAIIRVRVAYTAAEVKKQKLMVAITEDNIVDAQMYKDSTSLVYKHNHVLRDFLTIYSGTSILEDVEKVPGRVYEQTFIYEVSADWKAENCNIVAYVFNNEENIEVGQAAEAKLDQ